MRCPFRAQPKLVFSLPVIRRSYNREKEQNRVSKKLIQSESFVLILSHRQRTKLRLNKTSGLGKMVVLLFIGRTPYPQATHGLSAEIGTRNVSFEISPALMPLASLPIRPPNTAFLNSLCSRRLLVSAPLPPASLLIRFHSRHSKRQSTLFARVVPTKIVVAFKKFKIDYMGVPEHHHDHHDNTLLISKDTANPAVRITRIGLYLPSGSRDGD